MLNMMKLSCSGCFLLLMLSKLSENGTAAAVAQVHSRVGTQRHTAAWVLKAFWNHGEKGYLCWSFLLFFLRDRKQGQFVRVYLVKFFEIFHMAIYISSMSLSLPPFVLLLLFGAGWHRSHPRSIIITTTINDMHRMDEKRKLFFWPNRNDGTIHITKEKPTQRLESRAVCEQINKQTANETMMVVEQTTGWYEITIIFHDFSLLSM